MYYIAAETHWTMFLGFSLGRKLSCAVFVRLVHIEPEVEFVVASLPPETRLVEAETVSLLQSMLGSTGTQSLL